MNVHRPRLRHAVIGGAVLTLTLGGCVVDDARPEIRFVNHADEAVVVTIEGLPGDQGIELPPDGRPFYDSLGKECRGTAIVVKTVGGELVGRVEKPACVLWTLTINDDGTLTYEKN